MEKRPEEIAQNSIQIQASGNLQAHSTNWWDTDWYKEWERLAREQRMQP